MNPATRVILQVTLDELDFVIEVREILALARAKIVENSHPFATLNKCRSNMRTDEAGAAGNQILAHAASLHGWIAANQTLQYRSRGGAV